MISRVTVAVAAVALLAAGVPAAHASPPRPGCGFETVAPAGSDTYDGAAVGYATFDDGATHTLRCVVWVNGVEATATPVSTGSRLLVTEGLLHYTAGPADIVDLCPEVDGVRECHWSDGQLPPQEVIDALAEVFGLLAGAEAAYVDPLVCSVLAAIAPGVPGVLDITPAGDTTVAGAGPLWDCPPYGDLYRPS
jgi:hypothetical protein